MIEHTFSRSISTFGFEGMVGCTLDIVAAIVFDSTFTSEVKNFKSFFFFSLEGKEEDFKYKDKKWMIMMILSIPLILIPRGFLIS